MAEKQTIVINDIEYTEHQLTLGKGTFVNMLTVSLEDNDDD